MDESDHPTPSSSNGRASSMSAMLASSPPRKRRKVKPEVSYVEVPEDADIAGDKLNSNDSDEGDDEPSHDTSKRKKSNPNSLAALLLGFDGDSESNAASDDGETSTPSSTPDLSNTAEGKRRRGRPKKVRTEEEELAKEIQKLPPEKPTLDEEEGDFEIDPKGEEKINADGELQGDRRFKVNTFVLPPRHPARLYMFAPEVAKLMGYRDSVILFNKNRKLRKLGTDDEERDYLIKQGLLAPHLRGKGITMVTARSVFRLFGHKTIKGGKRIRDDYYVGDEEYESPVEEPTPSVFSGGDFDDANSQLSGRNNRSLLQRSISTSHIDYALARGLPVPNATEKDWMYQCALSVLEFNSRLASSRKAAAGRFYDVHTNVEQIAKNMQPQGPIIVEVEKDSVKSKDKKSTASDLEEDVVFRRPVGAPNPDEGNWAPVGSAPAGDWNEVKKYPIAVMPGQHQSLFSIYPARFENPNAPPPETFVKNTTNDHILPIQSSTSQFSNAMQPLSTHAEFYASLEASFNVTGSILCGAITRDGQPCKRPVTRVGEKCLYHNKETGYLPRSNPEFQPPVLETVSCAKCKNRHPSSGKSTLNCPVILISCTKCSKKFHPLCLELHDDPVLLTRITTYDWVCNPCKLCTGCNQAGNDDQVLLCDECDLSWHTYCLDPPLDEVPHGKWLCPRCTTCRSCKADHLPPSDSHHIFNPRLDPKIPPFKQAQNGQTKFKFFGTFCTACFENIQEDRYCPVCIRTYGADGGEDSGNGAGNSLQDQGDMICCDTCNLWVHVNCDKGLTKEQYNRLCQDEDGSEKYVCPVCK